MAKQKKPKQNEDTKKKETKKKGKIFGDPIIELY